jgi:hypothetical protein
LPYVEELRARTAGLSLTIASIAQDTEADVAPVAEELGLRFPIGMEEAPWSTSSAYRLTTVPTLVLVEHPRKVALVSVGFAAEDFREIARRVGARHRTPVVDPFRGEDVPLLRPG